MGLGAWVIVQMLATAYFRGVDGNPPASRYIDALAFGTVVNALSLGWLARHGRANPAARCARAFVALAWLAVVVVDRATSIKLWLTRVCASTPLTTFSPTPPAASASPLP